jgi:hypothetical protein
MRAQIKSPHEPVYIRTKPDSSEEYLRTNVTHFITAAQRKPQIDKQRCSVRLIKLKSTRQREALKSRLSFRWLT